MSSDPPNGTSLPAMLVKSLVLFGAVAAGNALRRAALMAGAYLAVAGLFGVSLCFLTLAGYRAISFAIGSVYASLIVGSIYLVIALITMLILQIRWR